MNYASNVEKLRETLEIDRAELAKRAGVDVSTISRWENGGVPRKGPAWAFLNGLAIQAGFDGLRPPRRKRAAA